MSTETVRLVTVARSVSHWSTTPPVLHRADCRIVGRTNPANVRDEGAWSLAEVADDKYGMYARACKVCLPELG